VTHPRAVRRHDAGAADFAARLTGRSVTAVRRRGKYLWLPLDSGEALTGHLGMSGQLLVVPADAPLPKHLHVRVRFADGGRELRFVDQRTFGGTARRARRRPRAAAARAHRPRPARPGRSTTRRSSTGCARRRTGVKRALLDQTLVSGSATSTPTRRCGGPGLHGERPTDVLTRRRPAPARPRPRRADRGHRGGGTSFDALYVSAGGVSGLFERSSTRTAARAAVPALPDADPAGVVHEPSSASCPRCQPRPRAARR
jgi:formamidopyrimidine-DNA glycosylase